MITNLMKFFPLDNSTVACYVIFDENENVQFCSGIPEHVIFPFVKELLEEKWKKKFHVGLLYTAILTNNLCLAERTSKITQLSFFRIDNDLYVVPFEYVGRIKDFEATLYNDGTLEFYAIIEEA